LDLMGGGYIVFHPGFFGKKSKEESYEKIISEVGELVKEVKKKKYKVKLCPETTGKKSVFGSVEEIKMLVDETGCSFCIDFAHVLAREGNYNFDLIKKTFGKFKDWHCHFSGIEYGEKGEKRHIQTSKKEWAKLFKGLPRGKNVSIICEAPDTIAGALEGLSVLFG
jgi:deoxyribonuclease-4